jgi:gamma-glutamyltranspeptidase/glutathione hydrolase
MVLEATHMLRRTFLVYVLLTSFLVAPFSVANTVSGSNGVVSSRSQIASDVGVKILKQGGNAVDAAVAVGFALAVTYPSAGSIGDGGFMVIRLDGMITPEDLANYQPVLRDPIKGSYSGYDILLRDGVMHGSSDPRSVGGASAF